MKIATTIHRPAACAAALLCAALTAQSATLVVVSRDAAGVGFNDPTPVAPVGGNTGTTLGAQRLQVYQFVAGLWGAALQSDVTITVNAGWEALMCSSTDAVLGSAAANNIWHDFPGSKPGTWYPQALANKIAGVNLSAGQPDDGFGNADIKTQFNVNFGKTGCFDGGSFYLGLDGKATGNQVNFMTTLLHEIGHGLGFSVLGVQTSTGNRVNSEGTAYAVDGLPSIWEGFMYDNTLGMTWLATATPAQRKASAIGGALTWNGPITVAGAAQTLTYPPAVQVASPAQKNASFFNFGTATFGTAVSVPMALGNVVDTASQVCSALPANSLKGKVAIVDRGTCGFAVKAKFVQDAGALGTIIVNNAAGAAPGMSGADATLVTPTVSVSQSDGAALRALVAGATKYGSRSTPGMVYASMGSNTSANKAGADAAGRPFLYTPSVLASGSSVSHWDTTAFPNQLMEPYINADLTNSLVPPLDLTLPVLKDIGW